MQDSNSAVEGNSQNQPSANVPRTQSTFPLMYHFFNTHRFGEYTPHYVEDSVKNDVLPVRSSHNVMSYTLKAPLMQNITMHKDYFSVPMEAILPRNWEKFFVNPVRGQDVPNDAGPTVADFWKKVAAFVYALKNSYSTLIADATTTEALALQITFRYLICGEYFYSHGSLMASLGCHGAPYLYVSRNGLASSWDKMFDVLTGVISTALGTSYYFTLNVDGETYYVSNTGYFFGTEYIDLRHALCLMRDNPTFTISASTATVRASLATALGDYSLTFIAGEVPFNTSRLWAYQLCCAHYYSNDHIDFIYSAELYRQLLGNYLMKFVNMANFSFSRNGVTYQYDYCSANAVASVLSVASLYTNDFLTTSNDAGLLGCMGYLSALFAYRRSLRYQDYFTGARAQVLAVGSTGVSVVNNTVDVVDVTRNIQRQRFLNAVNRVGHKFEDYLKDIFGGSEPAPDYHNPFFLCSTKDTIFGDETANTGAAQMQDNIAITTNLRSNGARYMFEIRSDRPCVVIGITHYDLPRVYSKTIERSFFHQDRFDMFNPFMQYIGDQPIYLNELGLKPSGFTNPLIDMNTDFAYTLRHMEYKQRYNQCAGGFVENLSGWIFIANDFRGTQWHINPDWIRSVNSEFDRFYVSLSGWSNGSYFHFIVDTYNDCSGSRPMAYAPSIL